MGIETLKTKYRYAGLKGVVTELAYETINNVVYFEVLKGMALALPDADPQYRRGDVPYECRFLTADEVRAFAINPVNDLRSGYVDEALRRCDRCFGLLDGPTLASYGWYAAEPTRVTDDFRVVFDPAYRYMHHCFTLHGYRGKRLHEIGMGRALELLTDEGHAGLVAVVAGNNFDSLKSTRRLGFCEFGQIYLLGRFGRHLVHADAGCRAVGFGLEPVNAGPKRKKTTVARERATVAKLPAL